MFNFPLAPQRSAQLVSASKNYALRLTKNIDEKEGRLAA
jgi:hypothetical protein